MKSCKKSQKVDLKKELPEIENFCQQKKKSFDFDSIGIDLDFLNDE